MGPGDDRPIVVRDTNRPHLLAQRILTLEGAGILTFDGGK
jgi:hypothetical protein